MSKKKTHEEFCSELFNINPNIIVVGTYNKAIDNIDVKCLNCGGEWSPIAASLLRGNGCPYCCSSPRKVTVGINDIWTTRPDLAKLMANPEDGFKYTENSGNKIDWKCPNCNQIIKNKRIANIARRGLSCNRCGDKVSYPEKFMFNLLTQLNISFEKEKIFDWLKNKRYDFYLNEFHLIVEMHGKQHYSVNTFGNMNKRTRSLKQEQKNDEIKLKEAYLNKIKNYIVIDSRYSDFDFIKTNIINSDLHILFDLSNIDWLECHKYACKSLIKIASDYWNNNKSTKEIASLMKLSIATVITYLKHGAELNLCDYNPKEELRKNGANNGKYKYKKVRCVETGVIFDSIIEAGKTLSKGMRTHISSCCNGKRKTCGKLEDGTPLHWEYII